MKYKTLLTGKGNSIIDDFFIHGNDNFESITTSLRYEDVIRHLTYFKPDIFIYCIYSESHDVYNQMANIKAQLSKSGIPFILIGSKEDCDDFAKYTVNIPDFTLLKPLTSEAIGQRISRFMRDWKPPKKKEVSNEDNAPLFNDLFLDIESALESDSQQRKHILVIDDSPIMLKTLKEHLRDEYDIATAVSGKVAMRFLERRKTDLILLDYEMPEESGPVVLEKLRSQESTKDIPVIFLTGVSDRGKIQEALVLKPQAYLLKPIDHDKLMNAIAKVIG